MRILTLIRHAKSSWDDPGLDDFDRPLNKRGKRDAPEMAQRLAAAQYVPDAIVASPAVRALTTAKVFAGALDFDQKAIQANQRVYLASVSELVSVIGLVDNAIRHLMVFGHNPGFTDLANRLSDVRIDNVPTCGVFSVRFDVPAWHEIVKGEGEFLFFDYPKNKDPVIRSGDNE